MIDTNSLGAIRWLVEAAAMGGSPDPEGLVAQMQTVGKRGNVAGINPAEAKRAGVPDVSEPFMSFSAAVKLDSGMLGADRDSVRRASAQRGSLAEEAISRRSLVQEAYTQAIASNTQPVNPFIDQQGLLVLHRQFPAAPLLKDTDTVLGEIVDDFLGEFDEETD